MRPPHRQGYQTNKSKKMKYPIYNVNEFVGGHCEFTTPCPFNIYGKYTQEILMVGSLACQRCEHFKGINREDCIVSCGIE